MRILITGGTGYIGSHVAIDILKNQHDLCIIDNLSNSKVNTIKKIKSITSKLPEFYKCSINDKKSLNMIFSQFKPEVVMHFAGLKSVNESIIIPMKYYENNVLGTINLLNIMERNNCNNIIFSSSATVYGLPNYSPCDEEHIISPINPYGKSKYFIEEIIKDWVVSGNRKSIILRYFNPVGAHKSGLIGELPNGTPNNLFPFITGVISESYEYLSVYGDDYKTRDGTGVRDYIHVADIAEAHVKSLNLLNEEMKSEIINLGTGKGFSVLEIINQFETLIKRKLPYKFKPKRSGDAPELIANNQKAKQLLNWEIKNNLEEICKDTLRWLYYYRGIK